MIKLFLLIAVLIAGVIVGPMLAGNQGYVLISAAHQTLEMSVTTFIILWVALLGVFFLLENLLKRLFSISSATSGWFSTRKTKKARRLTNEGFMKVIEGDWKQAEKLVVKGAKNSDTPVLNYLAAATAAQEQHNTNLRDEYLQHAANLDEKNLGVALTRAKLEFADKQYEQALATLQGLRHDNPNNTILLNLLKDCYLQLNDWQPLLTLLPSLEKSGLVTAEEGALLEQQAQCGLMTHLAQQKGTEGLLTYWSDLSRKQRQQVPLITHFVAQMTTLNADNQAFTVLKEALKKNNDNTLIAQLSELQLDDTHPAIVLLEGLVRNDKQNAIAHSALAQLLIREQKWTEAKTHLEQALEIQPTLRDYGLLVNVLEQLNEHEAAEKLSRQALNFSLPVTKSTTSE